MSRPLPTVGDVVYVHDVDITSAAWFRGGKATIARVYFEQAPPWVEVREIAGASWNWEALSEDQDRLRSYYGETIAGQRMLGSEKWV